MPHINVKLVPGKSEQQKTQLAGRIVQDVMEILHYQEDAVSVTMEEIAPGDWTDQVYKPDIQARWDKLYKKPGYKPE